MNNKFKKSFIFYIILFLTSNLIVPNKLILYLLGFLFIFFLIKKSEKIYFLVSILFLWSFTYTFNLKPSLNQLQFIFYNHYQWLLPSTGLLFLFFIYYLFQRDFQPTMFYPNLFALYSIEKLKSKKDDYFDRYTDSRKKINRTNIRYLLNDIPRHGYFRYTNYNSIPELYFTRCQDAIADDPRLYLILSETGSPASEIISLFTQTDYNHLSLSFDRSLKTMISYNGGNQDQKPGLNTEKINNLQQKDNSQLLVYSLELSKDDQLIILNKIRQINNEGSAYNVVGLLTHLSPQPNMMYCSEFVYHMLALTQAGIFEIQDLPVKPTDFIDYDLDVRLNFEYKIDFP